MENYNLSIHIAFWKESMINRLSNLINRNRSAAKISQVLCSSTNPACLMAHKYQLFFDGNHESNLSASPGKQNISSDFYCIAKRFRPQFQDDWNTSFGDINHLQN